MIYEHAPAIGLGHRDPRRPHVTGGIGAGIGVWRLLQYAVTTARSRYHSSHEGRTAVESRENVTDTESAENKRETETIGDFD